MSNKEVQEKIYVTRPSMPPFEEYSEMIRRLWDTHRITNMGEFHNKLEKELERYLDVENVSLMVNGHMALEMTIQAFEFPVGAEVITTPFTFASTTHAIVRNGLMPVFCDIDSETYCIDASKIEDLISEKTCAIIPVHVYGNICDVYEIKRIADKYGLKVIYDAAHAFGEVYDGVGVGNFGDASIFSFHATKVFNTIEGGAVCFKDEEIGKKLYDLKNFGIHGEDQVTAVGANAKMNEFQAAMGLCNLKYIDQEIEKRKRVYDIYKEILGSVDGIKFNKVRDNVMCNYAYFPVLIDEKAYGVTRDGIYEELKKNEIYARKYFYPLMNSFHAFNGLFNAQETPFALGISKQVLTLPIYAELNDEDVNRICDIILVMKKQ